MLRRAKKQNPNAVVVAVGCYAQVASDELERLEDINIIIGTKSRGDVVKAVEKYIADGQAGKVNLVSEILGEREFEPLSVSKLEGRTRAYVKVQDGCNRFCSYCIIPYARGPIRSRGLEDTLCEVNRLKENGFREIVLTGIHIASYGDDFKDGIGLVDLTEEIAMTDGIERIRFSSMEPLAVTEDFCVRLSALGKVCEHFHLSLQSGCDKTLKAMNRRYSCEQYMEAVERLRRYFKGVAITTDVIVGFPGESEEDFKESCEFVKRVGFSKVHVFPYSPKRGTKAEKMPDQLSNEIKKQRANELIKISDGLGEKFIKGFEKAEMKVLFERKNENGLYEGHTPNYIRVMAQSDTDICGQILTVVIGADVVDCESVMGEIVGI